jgi:hypothetical protein
VKDDEKFSPGGGWVEVREGKRLFLGLNQNKGLWGMENGV